MKRRITQLSPVVSGSRWAAAVIACALVASTLVGCGPLDPIQAAREQMISGDLDDSLETLREIVAEDAQNPEVLFLYGQVLVKTGQPGLAEWPLRKAMKDAVWFERAARLLAGAELAGGNFENAAQIYAEMLEANPDDLEIRVRRANACARAPQLLDEALAEVDRILEIDPEELGAYKPRILAYLGKNEPEEAGKAIEELGDRIVEADHPDDSLRGWHCATMAIFAADSGDEDLAHERWALCEEKFPSHGNVTAQSIEFHKTRDEMDRALEIAEAAFAGQTAEGSGYRLMLAQLLRDVGRRDEAEALLIEGADLSDDVVSQAATLLALTEHYVGVRDLDAAAETLERALGISQQSIGPQPDLLFSLADLFIQTGQGERALELSEQMTVPAHRSLVRARVAHDRKQYTQALKLYAETSRLWPENAFSPYHEARAAMAVGLFDRAFKSYLLSVRVDESATDARLQAARLLAAEGQIGSAMEMISTTRLTPGVNSELLLAELISRGRPAEVASNAANRMSQRFPEAFGLAVESVAKGASYERQESDVAWKIVEPLIELKLPAHNLYPILRAGVRYASDAAQLAELRPIIEREVQSGPDVAEIREIEGMLFDRLGLETEASASYLHVLSLEPNRSTTLLRLAGLTVETEPAKSIDLIRQALQAQVTSVEPLDSPLFISVISGLPNSAEVETLLESALEIAPASGQIAFRLAASLEANEGEDRRIVRLANRAIRFHAGPDAVSLRDRVKARI